MNKINSDLPFKILLKKCAGKISDIICRHRAGKESIRVLVYHNITKGYIPCEWPQMTTPLDLFDRQMRYLKENNYNVIAAEEIPKVLASGAAIPDRTVCITFDDGYRDNFEFAFPVIKKYGLKATIFITTDFINRDAGSSDGYLKWEEISEMKESGIFTFGCHSLSHKNLAGLNNNELDMEVRLAKRTLEDKLAAEINIYAYPFGWHSSFNDRVIAALKKERFLSAFTGISGANTRETDLFRLKRMRISWLDELNEFKMILRGSYDWYESYQKIVSIWQRP